MTDLVLYNYSTLVEQSMEHVNVHHVDGDGLKDGPNHPNVAGFYHCYHIIAKY